MPVDIARGYVMMLMVFMQNLHAMNCRSEKISAFKLPISRNWFIVVSVVSSILLQIIVMEIPLLSNFLSTGSIPILHILLILLCSVPILIVMEVFKKMKFGRR